MGFDLQNDLSPARWVADRFHDFGVDVGSVVPEGFDAYVRLLHPAWRSEGGKDVPVSWGAIAAANDRVVHPEMQWPNISGMWEHTGKSAPGLWDAGPEDGTLPRSLAGVLREILPGHTGTPDEVWWCVWNGYGDYTFQPAPTTPLLRLPAREYFLLSGSIDGITESLIKTFFWQNANLWWSDDRKWCVATEIDYCWTYVGGSEGCQHVCVSGWHSVLVRRW